MGWLEERVAGLESEIGELKRQFAEFRKQFEYSGSGARPRLNVRAGSGWPRLAKQEWAVH